MAKKVKRVAAAAGDQWATMIRDSATQIWLAGLGAFSKAQHEGTQLFNALVKEGEAVQKRTTKAAGDTVASFREQCDRSVGQARARVRTTCCSCAAQPQHADKEGH